MRTEYSAEEVGTRLNKLYKDYGTHYQLEGNDKKLHFKGFSNRETKWRLEPYFPILMECPNRYEIHINEDGSWKFYKLPTKRTATM